tara:strand:- start:2039 stop:2164 length:126 start_codon:yes stop_codon:yes gene_type:complete
MKLKNFKEHLIKDTVTIKVSLTKFENWFDYSFEEKHLNEKK